MPDRGHELTDELLEEMERKIRKEYQQAVKETTEKLNDYLEQFRRKDEKWQQLVADGKRTEKQYRQWRIGQIAVGDRWKKMRDSLAEDLHNANKIARSVIDGYKPDVYALNHNFATWQIETRGKINTSYTLYNREAVERILRETPDMLPPPGRRVQDRIDAGKDVAWQEGKIQSVTMQSIMQGESIPHMAERIMETIGGMNYAAAVRYARTAMTGAQNAGRYDAYRRAAKMGVELTVEWLATLDNRTRHEHRQLHGQRQPLDVPFEVDGFEILYPGQVAGTSDIPQKLIWNCRCSIAAWVKGFEPETVKEAPGMEGMSFEEWQQTKPNYYQIKKEHEARYGKPKKPPTKKRQTKEGKDNGP